MMLGVWSCGHLHNAHSCRRAACREVGQARRAAGLPPRPDWLVLLAGGKRKAAAAVFCALRGSKPGSGRRAPAEAAKRPVTTAELLGLRLRLTSGLLEHRTQDASADWPAQLQWVNEERGRMQTSPLSEQLCPLARSKQ